LVQRDDILRSRQLGRNHGLLRRIIGSLRVQHGEEWIDPRTVTGFSEVIGVRCRDLLALARGNLVIDRAAAGEGVGHFSECGLDRALIIGDRRGALRLTEADVRAARSRVEDGIARVRAGAPREGAAGEQLGERAAGEPEQPCQRDAREQGRSRSTDLRIRCAQLVFRLQDVGTAQEDVRVQSHGHGRNLAERFVNRPGQQRRLDRRAN